MEAYTVEQITEMCETWVNYNGFTGETCGMCHKTANVFSLGTGWFCDCGHYNDQSWYYTNIPHEKPDMGNFRSVIYAGHKNSTKWQSPIN
jgi:hypothetical protein